MCVNHQNIQSKPGSDVLFSSSGMVQGATDDGKKLNDELDIEDPNSDSDEEEERKRVRQTQPFIPSYLRMLEDDSSQKKKRGPKSIHRTTRRMFYCYRLREPYGVKWTASQMCKCDPIYASL